MCSGAPGQLSMWLMNARPAGDTHSDAPPPPHAHGNASSAL